MKENRQPLIFLSCIAIILAVLLHGAHPDDAYIYARVAFNLSAGLGYVYNLGEFTNPCSGPLYPIMLAGLIALGLSADLALSAVFFFSQVIGAFTLYSLFRAERPALAWALAFGWLLQPTLLQSIGMETSAYVCVALLACVASIRGWFILAGSLAATCTLLRPDGLVVVGIVLLQGMSNRVQAVFRAVVPCMILLGCWIVFSFLYFGAMIPHSVNIKLHQPLELNWHGQPDFLQAMLAEFSSVFLVVPLAFIGLWDLVQRRGEADRILLAFSMAGFMQAMIYGVSRAPGLYFWYLAHILLVLNLLIIVGLNRVLLYTLKIAPSGAPRAPRDALVGFLAAGVVGIAGADSPQGIVRSYRLSEEYIEAARYAREAQYESIAATEIGYLGFYFPGRIVDIHGLLHREYLPTASSEYWWLTSRNPACVILHKPTWIGEPSDRWPEEVRAQFTSSFVRVKESLHVELYCRARPGLQS